MPITQPHPSILPRRLRETAAELAESDLARASRLVAGSVNLLHWAAEEIEKGRAELLEVVADRDRMSREREALLSLCLGRPEPPDVRRMAFVGLRDMEAEHDWTQAFSVCLSDDEALAHVLAAAGIDPPGVDSETGGTS